jgi:hypothetical protein
MKIEFLILGLTAFFIANAYHDGKYVAILKSWKKYYQMAFIGFLGLSLYIFIKRNPAQSHSLIKHANGIIKYMPIDKNTTDMLTPILDFSNQMGGDVSQVGGGNARLMNSGKTGNKRSVSETKKKFVASNQNWKCNSCKQQLTAWFEVHHMQPLEHGGSNHIENLEALCRNCHGEKTALDNL